MELCVIVQYAVENDLGRSGTNLRRAGGLTRVDTATRQVRHQAIINHLYKYGTHTPRYLAILSAVHHLT
jgi:putative cell wall-binding protein